MQRNINRLPCWQAPAPVPRRRRRPRWAVLAASTNILNGPGNIGRHQTSTNRAWHQILRHFRFRQRGRFPNKILWRHVLVRRCMTYPVKAAMNYSVCMQIRYCSQYMDRLRSETSERWTYSRYQIWCWPVLSCPCHFCPGALLNNWQYRGAESRAAPAKGRGQDRGWVQTPYKCLRGQGIVRPRRTQEGAR